MVEEYFGPCKLVVVRQGRVEGRHEEVGATNSQTIKAHFNYEYHSNPPLDSYNLPSYLYYATNQQDSHYLRKYYSNSACSIGYSNLLRAHFPL